MEETLWHQEMGRRIQIAPHLGLDELEQRYRQSKDGVERSHYQIIWLLAQGQRSEDVAAVTGYSRQWIYELVWGYNRLGAEALGDKRHQNPGAQPRLNAVQQAQLWQLLQAPPADGDLWDDPEVARWMSELLGHPVHPQRGWDYLRGLGMRLRRPRPMHQETDPEAQQAGQKNWRRPSPM